MERTRDKEVSVTLLINEPFRRDQAPQAIDINPVECPTMKFIILGTGQAAEMNMRAVRMVKGMELAAVHSSDPEQGRRFASRHHTLHLTEVGQVAERSDIEVAIIASTPDMHRRQLEQLVDRVPYIFVEKPFGLSADEARLMAQMAKQSTSSVAVLYKHRFDEAYGRIRHLVQSGGLGRILNVTFIMSQFRDDGYLQAHGGWRRSIQRSGGGVLLQQGIHWINFLFGVLAMKRKHRASWHLRMPGGIWRISSLFT